MKHRKSPCISICDYTNINGWCEGCGMTYEESTSWRKMRIYDKKILLKQLQNRLLELKSIKQN